MAADEWEGILKKVGDELGYEERIRGTGWVLGASLAKALTIAI